MSQVNIVERTRIKVSQLKPAPYNPRDISDKQRQALVESIKEFGLVQELVWNKRTKHVVGGNQRLSILKELGVKTVPVSVVDLSLVDEKLLNVILNSPDAQGFYTDDLVDLVEDIRLELPDIAISDTFNLGDLLEREIVVQVPDPPKRKRKSGQESSASDPGDNGDSGSTGGKRRSSGDRRYIEIGCPDDQLDDVRATLKSTFGDNPAITWRIK